MTYPLNHPCSPNEVMKTVTCGEVRGNCRAVPSFTGAGRRPLTAAASLGRKWVAAATDGAPSRAIVILPGLGNSSSDYNAFSKLLSSRGYHVETAAVARVDWARNALGLRYRAYWTGKLEPRPTVDWYLNRVKAAVDEAKCATDGAPITLLAHSAGGWLGRVYMRDFGSAGVDRFVTLGSPHNPPPKDIPGVIDQTRGILNWVQENCPGAFQSNVSYTSVAGKYIKGAPLVGGGAGGVPISRRIVGAGYQQVCGVAEEWGDGIVPVPAALLAGSRHIVLEGVYHSPVGAVDVDPAVGDAGNGAAARPWYGSRSVIDCWIESATGAAATAQA